MLENFLGDRLTLTARGQSLYVRTLIVRGQSESEVCKIRF